MSCADATAGRRGRVVAAALAVSLVALVGLGGCRTTGVAFRVDERVEVVSPDDNSSVRLPVTVRWEAKGRSGPGALAALDGVEAFGVFVNRVPPPPGKTLAWLFRRDKGCRPAEGCPDADYLAERGVHRTTDTELVIESLSFDDDSSRDGHRVVIVLLDEQDRRIGESAFDVEFDVDSEE